METMYFLSRRAASLIGIFCFHCGHTRDISLGVGGIHELMSLADSIFIIIILYLFSGHSGRPLAYFQYIHITFLGGIF